MQSQSEVKSSFKLLLLASAVTVALWFIPFAGVLTYPFRIFVTLIHEMGHAIAALATFGGVYGIALDWGGGGVTLTDGDGWGLLISSAGYLSTTLYGSSLLLLLRRARNAKPVALATGILLLVMTAFFGGNLLAWLAGLLFGFVCLAMALKGNQRFVHFFMSFLAIQSLLNAFYDLRTLMYLSAFDSTRPTDAQNMAAATGGFVPAIAWAVGWSILSCAILAFTLMIYYRSLKQREALALTAAPALIASRSQSASNRNI